MTVEERLKELIIEKYGTMKDFTDHIGIPNSTFANILRRGVKNANVLTIIKVCQALGISTDDLAEGKIVPTARLVPKPKRIEDIIFNTKQELLNAEHLTLDDQPISEAEAKIFIMSLDMIVELEKKRMINNDKN